MSDRSAYFFVYHGSRDQRSSISANVLAQNILNALGRASVASSDQGSRGEADDVSSPTLFQVGALELASSPLHQQIADFGWRVARRGVSSIVVMPLFLLAGTHVCDDIPEEVAIAQSLLGSAVDLHRHPHLGAHPRIVQWLGQQVTDAHTGYHRALRIFVSHGSKKTIGHQPTEAIAEALGARSAYWSLAPSLDQCLAHEISTTTDRTITAVRIIPYFLFSGKITDAIAQTVQDYRRQFPMIHFRVTPPIGEQASMAHFIADWLAPAHVAIDYSGVHTD
jgi:sirohydrochlorin ferrochelatase